MNEFIEIYPKPWQREVIVDFESMETAVVPIALKPFAMGKYPVTNVQYDEFLQKSRYVPKDLLEFDGDVFLANWENQPHPSKNIRQHPVTFVSYDDAYAYAVFAGGRLPAYHEWLYAAFGASGWRFPWGDTFFPNRCNVRESGNGGTRPVGFYSPEGDSPVGCCDMIGNVWEWTQTRFGSQEEYFMALGTGWDHFSVQTEIPLNREYRNHSVGFRIVREL